MARSLIGIADDVVTLGRPGPSGLLPDPTFFVAFAGDDEMPVAVRKGCAPNQRTFIGFVVAVSTDAGLEVTRKTIQVFLEDDVHHARDRVRTIRRGRAAGYHLQPVYQRAWDYVRIDQAAGGRGDKSAAVHEDERLLRAQATQVEVVLARVLRRNGGAGRGIGLFEHRQFVDELTDIRRGGTLDL